MAMGGSNQTNYIFIIHKGKLKKNIPYSIARYIYHRSGLKSKLSLLNPLLSEKNKEPLPQQEPRAIWDSSIFLCGAGDDSRQ